MPLWYYVILTCIFFFVSIANNKAYAFNISMPVHMVFRASSLAASMLVGYLCFKKKYERYQVLAVVMVSAGIITTTIADAMEKRAASLQSCCDNDSVVRPDSAFLQLPDSRLYLLRERLPMPPKVHQVQNLACGCWAFCCSSLPS